MIYCEFRFRILDELRVTIWVELSSKAGGIGYYEHSLHMSDRSL